MKVLVALTGQGESTLWVKVKVDPRLKPVKLGDRVTRFRVGGIRQYLRGEPA